MLKNKSLSHVVNANAFIFSLIKFMNHYKNKHLVSILLMKQQHQDNYDFVNFEKYLLFKVKKTVYPIQLDRLFMHRE